ncbi:MAG: iron ABC transporter permease [Rivularia sp. ALOHA_DT_140]|nr:iron ABC transporter permease [Rivularia sp. ALOHA_DT_140]
MSLIKHKPNKLIKSKNRHILEINSLLFLTLLINFIFLFLIDIALGSVHIPIQEVITILLGQETTKATWTTIIWKFRLPKAITATLAGAALGTSGLQMQTLFRNPVAGPFILGISSGASLGVALAILAVSITGVTELLQKLEIISDFSLIVAASLGAALVLGLVLIVSRRVQDTMTLLNLGLLFGYATGAFVSILLNFSETQQIQSYLQWTVGSFSAVTWRQMLVLAPIVLLALLMSVMLSKSLNTLLLGENYARSLGLSVQKARFWIITSASILSGAITVFCGPIAFLGVAVPHLCRSLFKTSDHRILLPAVIFVGPILALIADLLSQLPVTE